MVHPLAVVVAAGGTAPLTLGGGLSLPEVHIDDFWRTGGGSDDV